MNDLRAEPDCPLLQSLIAGDREGALEALAAGADVTARDLRPLIGDGQTALHLAVALDDAEIVNAIVEKGADIDAQTTNGQTPLWLACNGGHANSIVALLNRGANPNLRNDEGYSPLGRLAASDPTLLNLLRSRGATS